MIKNIETPTINRKRTMLGITEYFSKIKNLWNQWQEIKSLIFQLDSKILGENTYTDMIKGSHDLRFDRFVNSVMHYDEFMYGDFHIIRKHSRTKYLLNKDIEGCIKNFRYLTEEFKESKTISKKLKVGIGYLPLIAVMALFIVSALMDIPMFFLAKILYKSIVCAVVMITPDKSLKKLKEFHSQVITLSKMVYCCSKLNPQSVLENKLELAKKIDNLSTDLRWNEFLCFFINVIQKNFYKSGVSQTLIPCFIALPKDTIISMVDGIDKVIEENKASNPEKDFVNSSIGEFLDLAKKIKIKIELEDSLSANKLSKPKVQKV